MIRILHITAQKTSQTGSGIYLTGLVDGLMSVSKNALVVGIDVEDMDDIKHEDESKASIEVYPLFFNTDKLPFHVPGMSDTMPYMSTRYRDMNSEMIESYVKETRANIEKAIEEFNPDVIISHHLYITTAITREIADRKKKKIPIIAICHGTCLRQLITTELDHPVYNNRWVESNIRKLNTVLALHEEQKELIEKMFKLNGGVKVIGSGFNPKFFNMTKKTVDDKSDSIKFVFAGKIAKAKGLVSLMRAIEIVEKRKSIDMEFYFAGSGNSKLEFDEIFSLANGLRSRTVFLGQLSQEELAEKMKESDVFILPSFYEGLPVVILEAMACGCDVISTDIKGLRNWLGEKINKSNRVIFVDLPVMKHADIPDEKSLPDFEEKLARAIEKISKNVIERRSKYRDKASETNKTENLLEKNKNLEEINQIEHGRFDDKQSSAKNGSFEDSSLADEISKFTWDGLAKKVYSIIKDVIDEKKIIEKKDSIKKQDSFGKRVFFVDYRAGEKSKEILRKRGYLIEVGPQEVLYEGISSHPDIQVCPISENDLVVCPESYDYISNQIKVVSNNQEDPKNINIIKGYNNLSRRYPGDVRYNLCVMGDKAVHNFGFTDEILKREIQSRDYKLIDVKQGYSNCSIAVVDENSCITSDKGICKELIKHGIDVLLIDEGFIKLEGMDSGFIGGAGGRLSDDEYFFFGNIKTHPNYEPIRKFIESRGMRLVYTEDEELEDLGSLLSL